MDEPIGHFRQGDRVRVRNPHSEYTGCRGTIVDVDEPGVTALGRRVAIDGENGVARPFLVADLERLRAARVAGRSEEHRRSESEGD
ncbi:MAG: hypothetical protein R3F35_02510 [Myxococcota bacterium]